MTTDPMLTLAQWFSPSYPIGAFAYSHGLEQAITDGHVDGRDTLAQWIETVLRDGAGYCDAVFIAAAYDSDAEQVDRFARAFVSSKERLMETDLQGAAFGQITGVLSHDETLNGLTYPVAVGRAARRAGLPLGPTTSMYLHAFVSSLVSVGIRLIPLGQTNGHQIIAQLAQACSDVAHQAQDATLDDLSATAFAADIAAMRHETLTSRVFRT